LVDDWRLESISFISFSILFEAEMEVKLSPELPKVRGRRRRRRRRRRYMWIS